MRFPVGFPSGQRGQTVNLLVTPSMVRIHLPPPFCADVAELADALRSGRSSFIGVWVRIPPSAPFLLADWSYLPQFILPCMRSYQDKFSLSNHNRIANRIREKGDAGSHRQGLLLQPFSATYKIAEGNSCSHCRAGAASILRFFVLFPVEFPAGNIAGSQKRF